MMSPSYSMSSLSKAISPSSGAVGQSPTLTVSLAGTNAHSSKYGKKQLSTSNGRKNGTTSRDPPGKNLTSSNSISNFAYGGGKSGMKSALGGGTAKAGKATLS